MNSGNIRDYHLWHPFTQMDEYLKREQIVIERGHGVYLYDVKGKEYLNLTSCLWNVPLGLGRTEIIKAITQQLNKLGYSALFRAAHLPALQLASIIRSLTPRNLSSVFFTSNGSESIETAIKMARLFFRINGLNKYKFISLNHSYHGVSYGALAASGISDDKVGFEPFPPGFRQIPAPYCYRCEYGLQYPTCKMKCATALEDAILQEGANSVAGFLCEPILGFGGVIIPPNEYFSIVQSICRKHGILLIIDEVTTGFGRTGKLFASEHWAVEPDIMTLGKGMSGGYYPLGATVASSRIWKTFLESPKAHFNHGSTNSGHPGACAAGLKTIELIVRENLVDTAKSRGERFYNALQNLRQFPIVGDVRGIGMMFALEFVEDNMHRVPLSRMKMDRILRQCFASGLWVHPQRNKILLLPPLVMGDDLLDDAYKRLERIIAKNSGKK